MQRLILRNSLSPGDIVMLTAAVRDLHRGHPGRYLTDLRTSCSELWKHNPHVTPLDDADPTVRSIVCHYPLIHHSNHGPWHFIFGFMDYLSDELGVRIRPTEFRGDLHLSEREKKPPPAVEKLVKTGSPYWIVCAGGKYDYTIKWWHWRRYQAVVDHFRDRLTFVQVGEGGHYHPPLKNVIDLRGKTSLRDLVRLVYHADGVLCGVTLLMHLAPAVPLPPGRWRPRNAVIIAGGREPPQWEAYPTHRFLHTVGLLPCCAHGGCWKDRTLPLGDEDAKDAPDRLCLNVVNALPRCMDMITAESAIAAIDAVA